MCHFLVLKLLKTVTFVEVKVISLTCLFWQQHYHYQCHGTQKEEDRCYKSDAESNEIETQNRYYYKNI